MRRIILILAFVFIKDTLYAQAPPFFKWARQMTGPTAETVEEIKVDELGNVYTAGAFIGTVDFDPGPGVFNLTAAGSSGSDIFVSKLDANGNFVWAKRIGTATTEYNFSLALDKDANVYITSFVFGTMDVDPGPGVFNLTALGNEDIFVLKLSSDGDFIWAKQMGGEFDEEGTSVTTDQAGDVYLTGTFKSTVDFDPGPGIFNLTAHGNITTNLLSKSDVFICKLDSKGNFIWAKSVGGNNDERTYHINVSGSGDVFVTGSFRNAGDFDPGPASFLLTSAGEEDIFILKLSADGDFIWARSVGGIVNDLAYGSVTDETGNVYVTGIYRESADFDPGPGVFTMSAPVSAIFVLKLSPAGDFIWAKSIGNGKDLNEGLALALDDAANVYVSGTFSGPLDFDPGPGTYSLNSALLDIFLLKLNKDGDFIWARAISGPGLEDCRSVTVDKFSNIYMTGSFGQTVDFDPGITVFDLTAIYSDAYIVKLAQCNNTTYGAFTAAACGSYTLNGHTFTHSGTYTQTLFNTLGCDSILTLNLTIHPEGLTLLNRDICIGQSYYVGGANQTTSGIYRDTLKTTFGCDSIIVTNLVVHALPKPDLGKDGNRCSPNTSFFLTPGIFSSYLWQDNSTGSQLAINTAGKYWVTVKDAYGCAGADTVYITAIDTIPQNMLPANRELCYGNGIKIAVPGYRDYLWSNGQITNVVTLSSFGKFYLTVTDFNNCRGKDSITLIKKDCIPIGIPNAFTPNGDTKNDNFRPTINQAVNNYSFSVFNRFGEKMFETHQYGIGWDGTYKGKPQSMGTYVYRIVYTNIFGIVSDNKGTVMLLR